MSFTQWACFMAVIGVPVAVAFIWGSYRADNIFSVFGIAARRGGGAVITETRPVGESLLNGATGNGFRPGQYSGANDRNSLRPGQQNQNQQDQQNQGWWGR
jgi:hypothetical protein